MPDALHHSVTLRVNGSYELTRWSGYEITVDMFNPAQAWTFTLFEASELDRTEFRRIIDETLICIDDTVEVSIDEHVVLVGRVENFRFGSDRSGANMTISGRTLVGKLVDFDANPKVSLAKVSVVDAFSALLSEFDFNTKIVFLADDDETLGLMTERLATLRPSANLPRRLPRQSGRRSRPRAGAPPTRIAGVGSIVSGSANRVAGVGSILGGITSGNAATGMRAASRVGRLPRIDRFHPQPGERVWTLMERILTNLGLMAWEIPDWIANDALFSQDLLAFVASPRTDADWLTLAVGTPARADRVRGVGTWFQFRHIRTGSPSAYKWTGNVLSCWRTINAAEKPAVYEVYAANALGDRRPATIVATRESVYTYGRYLAPHIPWATDANDKLLQSFADANRIPLTNNRAGRVGAFYTLIGQDTELTDPSTGAGNPIRGSAGTIVYSGQDQLPTGAAARRSSEYIRIRDTQVMSRPLADLNPSERLIVSGITPGMSGYRAASTPNAAFPVLRPQSGFTPPAPLPPPPPTLPGPEATPAQQEEYAQRMRAWQSDMTAFQNAQLRAGVYRLQRGPAERIGSRISDEGIYRHKKWALDFLGKMPFGIRRFVTRRAKTADAAVQEAKIVCLRDFRDHDVVELVVQGHSQEVGGQPMIYTVNTFAGLTESIVHGRLHENYADYVITRVTYQGSSSGGCTTSLRLHPPKALEIERDPLGMF